MTSASDSRKANVHRNGAVVLSSFIDAISWNEVLKKISMWARAHESRYVCICNVHSVVTAHQNPAFLAVLTEADAATPDGMPIAWSLRKMGFANQERINGPDLMWRYCQLAEQEGQKIYFYGSTSTTLNLLNSKLLSAFPKLLIAGMYSPPFRVLSSKEDAEIIEQINSSGAAVVFVSLGCPKQEMWMSAHRGKINAVTIGVGAAFDYHAGTIRRAPKWMQEFGLEWLYRFLSEPRRLWRRYLTTNIIFIIRVAIPLMIKRKAALRKFR